MFNVLGLPKVRENSTDVAVLEHLSKEHEVIPYILAYREKSKLVSTYLKPFLEKQINGVIYGRLNQLGSASGRWSSADPNKQNIPTDADMRSLFIASPGCMLIDSDYSQIEGVVFAHCSQDPILLKTYREGGDIHTATSEKLGVPRKLAKVCNFAIIYGCFENTLSENMKKEGFDYSKTDARKFKDDFWKLYREGEKFVNGVKHSLHREGHVSTIFGRRRYFPEIFEADGVQRYAIEREAVNHVVQGTAADILKYAIVDVDAAFEITKLGNILFPIQDEILGEAEEGKAHEALQIMERRMRDTKILSVPLLTEGKIGRNWAEVH